MGDVMKVVIIDDDINFANKLKNYLIKFNTISFDIEVNNYDKEFELYFLDIDMPDMDGISYARSIKKKYPLSRIIFVSYRSDLVFDAIQVFPFSFVRKEKMNEELPMVLEEICELEKDKKKMLKINEQFSLPVDNICYIEKRGSYAHIYTESNVYKLRKSLSNIFDFMNSYFVYINKGTIVNMKYVNEYQKENIILKDGTVLYMSRGRRSEFMLSYLKYKEEI